MVCNAIDNEPPFDEILWSTYTESHADWDTDAAAVFLGSAIYGVCPEHAVATGKWLEEI